MNQATRIRLSQIIDLLNCEVLFGMHALDRTTDSCIASDTMSFVLAFGRPGAILITSLLSPQAIRTAYMADAIAIVFVRGKRPDPSILELGRETDLPIFTTNLGIFETCSRLAASGLDGIG
jgi:hypothetical protein